MRVDMENEEYECHAYKSEMYNQLSVNIALTTYARIITRNQYDEGNETYNPNLEI